MACHAARAGHVLSHYRLSRRSARGHGVVWKAVDVSLAGRWPQAAPRQPAADAQKLARLESEAKTIAALNHPHIVTLYSIEEADDRRFLTMELVSGRTLAEVIPPDGLPSRRSCGSPSRSWRR